MRGHIVYGQQELMDAISGGISAVTLCSGIYEIPLAPGVSFERLGPVKVSVSCTKAEADAAGMVFSGIYPEYKNGYAIDSRVPLYTVAAISSGSFAGLGYGSYGYGGSFSGFPVGSYGGSFSGFFVGSYGVSFSRTGSMGGSFASGSFAVGSSGSSADAAASGSFASLSGGGMPYVILGYGIDLI